MEYDNITASRKIKELKSILPARLLQKHFEIYPELKEKYSQHNIEMYLEDTRYHLSYLAESIASNEPRLFNDYLGWVKSFFKNLPVTDMEILDNLKLLRDELKEHLSEEMANISTKFINEGINNYELQSTSPPSFIDKKTSLGQLAEDYLNFLLDGNKNPAQTLIINAVQSGISVKEIYLNIFQITQKESGRLWQLNKISVAQEHYITAATQLIMSQLYPYIFNNSAKKHKIIVTCIAGELHEIGVRMVADLFEMDGWDSYYFGANTPQSSLITSVKKYKPEILAVSATMTFNLSAVRELINSIRNDDEIKDLKIIVGGYPFTISDNLWQKMGADGFAEDAEKAVELAKNLLKD